MNGTILGLLAAGLLIAGCGASSMESGTRSALATTAHLVESVDRTNADAMARTREADIEASTTRQEALRRRAPYWRVQESVDGLRALLFSAEAFVDATGGEGFSGIAGCIAMGVIRLRSALEVLESATGLDLRIPAELDSVLSVLGAWGAASCEVPNAS